MGGGIAGLSAAWALERAARPWLLLEAAPRFGGSIHTVHAHGFLMEAGPDSFLASKPPAIELCRSLDLEDQLIGTQPSPTGPQVLFRGRLQPLPAGWRLLAPTRLAPVLRSPLFSLSEKAALLWHWHAASPPRDSESALAYLHRRFGVRAGGALAARVTAPLLAGVYGGSIAELSAAPMPPPAQAPHPGPASFLSLRGGMGTLIERLLQRLPSARLRSSCRVLALQPSSSGYTLMLDGGASLAARAVVLATPAWQSAALLAACDPALAALLAAIPCASSVNVYLAYRSAPPLPPGHGFLVTNTPRRDPGPSRSGQGAPTTGRVNEPGCSFTGRSPRQGQAVPAACTFTHQKFTGRAPAGAALLRLFYGAALVEHGDAELSAQAQADLRSILGISAPPDFVTIHRAARALPQYTVGHGARLRAIAAALARHPGLALAGNAFAGVGIPDCIASGEAAATVG